MFFLGGTPVIKGTRVPIGRILFLLKDGYTLEAIHDDDPHIDLQTLSAAIDEAIDALIQPSMPRKLYNFKLLLDPVRRKYASSAAFTTP